MSTVLQPWVEAMPWKLQSILFSGLRGPDTGHCPNVKEVSRWVRRVVQNDADPSQSYMAPRELPRLEALEKELEFGSVHFLHHFADALRCIAIYYRGGDESTAPWGLTVSTYARKVHDYMADELLHWIPESDEVFVRRHRDRVAHD